MSDRGASIVDAASGGTADRLRLVVGMGHISNDQTEMVAQLQRTLALLKGCEAPGMRAQLEHIVANLRGRIQQMVRAAGEQPPRNGADALPIPGPQAHSDVTPAECRAYAIQCEAMASIGAGEQRAMLRALARLWRALAAA